MKLLNRSLLYLSVAFLLVISVWSVVFYLNLKDEIRDSIDDGLDNNRLLLIQNISDDPRLLDQREFGGNNFKIHPLAKASDLPVQDIYKDTLMYRLNENDLEPVRLLHTTFEYDNRHYRLTVISSLVEEDDLIEDAFWSVVWLFLILVSSIILINNLVLRQVWNPFYAILRRLKTYRLDKDETPINVATDTREFAELQKASNTLIDHAREAYSSQKQFTENAAHELQTPLATIANKLELLLESDSLTETDANVIAAVLHVTSRLSRLNTSLLLLAKIENKQFAAPQRLSINALAQDFISDFEEFTDFKKVQISTEEEAVLVVNMDTTLAGILISNLIRNAVFHNVKGGKIKLQFCQETFTICNTGRETALHPERIFNRFQKDSTHRQSTGLGLAICQAIGNYYGLPLHYRFEAGEHCFKVDFKKIIASD